VRGQKTGFCTGAAEKEKAEKTEMAERGSAGGGGGEKEQEDGTGERKKGGKKRGEQAGSRGEQPEGRIFKRRQGPEEKKRSALKAKRQGGSV